MARCDTEVLIEWTDRLSNVYCMRIDHALHNALKVESNTKNTQRSFCRTAYYQEDVWCTR